MAALTLISGLANSHSQVLVEMQQLLPQWFWLTIPILLLYMTLVSTLRYQRALYLPKKFNLLNRESYRKMTTDEAQSILKDLTELEFPKIFGFSVIFALFKARNTFLLLICICAACEIPCMHFNILATDLRYSERLSSPCHYRST